MLSSGAHLPADSPVTVRDRSTVLTCGALLAIAAVAWVHVVTSSTASHDDMAMGTMTPTLVDATAFVAAWGVMMTAMMLPSALPMIALYGAIRRKAADAATKGVPVAVFTLVYLALWAIAGVPVYAGSVLVDVVAADLVPYGVALVLVVAGVYQLSPLKQVCLRACRSPLGFLLGRWRPGHRGSLALAWAHAMYCLGCCWALMLVLVVAGAMGLPWVLLIAALVTVEKLSPGGEWIARVAGSVLVVLGLVLTMRPDVVAMLRAGHVM